MRTTFKAVLAATLLMAPSACTPGPTASVVTWEEIARLPVPPADHRVEYGSHPLQFGELRLPGGPGPHPVAVVIHGGCWRSEYDLQHISNASEALTRAGIATWTLEYRRIGDAGGGWTGTFEDVAAGTDYLRTLAQQFPLDLDRVALLGHSAGGHLALWLAARPNLPEQSALSSPDPLPVRGVVSLAGIPDLRAYSGPNGCNSAVVPLLGGTPDEVPERYSQASPIELLPLGVPQRLVHGARDAIVPVEQSRRYVARARERGDDAQLRLVEGAGHFDLIAPFAPAWTAVEEAVRSLLSTR
jgi:acetyl esterase/lipase